ncbi:RNA polymerase II nuclear import protein Iwr1 [Schizosaccharomyces pombe]|uniref:RNA polymerase II nuclear localization protein iwr1 n=1 Tax=Schizosaccharomyces pombe (strain 972 / ATCC 24843) TaxID=284812 RepID=IWR1_SCHPO|nr:putative RNA polymerase II nuclear import protein Iwr1 [Schizosaccharomyces pombe]O13951.1 RecName: Full=RNA polymerase II nuclear localization protein iwr1 [Schizosaccharomyces pombe 972h-]CAB11662.1 RNA polymerase II nuclear import protein Iwr1 (predicted) [Schizosaccharomyces pombe]|eukprot:NP_593398.1 putative RNA polymerase II nuclear import protein Iwr1 [Schizosaccharomyces pombe]
MPLPVLRVKRKASEDPVNALYLELGNNPNSVSSTKRRKFAGRYYFKLSQTLKQDDRYIQINDESSEPTHEDVRNIHSHTKISSLKKNNYGIPVVQTSEDVVKAPTHMDLGSRENTKGILSFSSPRYTIQNLPSTQSNRVFDAIRVEQGHTTYHPHPQLDSMIQEYLSNGDLPLQQSTEDYVYDIYEASSKEPNKPTFAYGVIDALSIPDAFRSSLEQELVSETVDSDKDDPLHDEIDEDSNAESFYQNSYPDEDEWQDSSENDEFAYSDDAEQDFYD